MGWCVARFHREQTMMLCMAGKAGTNVSRIEIIRSFFKNCFLYKESGEKEKVEQLR